MKYRIGLLITGLALASTLIFANGSAATNTGQVCSPLSSGKIDVSGSIKFIDVTAPSGSLISRYCVKAGSINNDNGPVYVDVDPPAATVRIAYPNGKDISHYSVEYVTTTTSTTSTTSTTTSTTSTTSSTTSTSTTSTVPSTTTSTTVPVTTTTNNVVNTTTTSIPIETSTTLQPAVVSDQAAVEERPQELASTGFDSSMLIFVGILLVLVGVVMIVFCRRRKDDD